MSLKQAMSIRSAWSVVTSLQAHVVQALCDDRQGLVDFSLDLIESRLLEIGVGSQAQQVVLKAWRADCHVIPLSFYSEELGTTELPELRMMITNAQGNAIRTTETRANITFESQKENGRTLKVIDSCVFGEVTQPLFAVGKLWKTGWGMEPYSHEKAFLVKGNSRIPISFHRNSTMTEELRLEKDSKNVWIVKSGLMDGSSFQMGDLRDSIGRQGRLTIRQKTAWNFRIGRYSMDRVVEMKSCGARWKCSRVPKNGKDLK